MALIHIINGLNGDIIKWREPELQNNTQIMSIIIIILRKTLNLKDARETCFASIVQVVKDVICMILDLNM
jgi:hypothetical protein